MINLEYYMNVFTLSISMDLNLFRNVLQSSRSIDHLGFTFWSVFFLLHLALKSPHKPRNKHFQLGLGLKLANWKSLFTFLTSIFFADHVSWFVYLWISACFEQTIYVKWYDKFETSRKDYIVELIHFERQQLYFISKIGYK